LPETRSKKAADLAAKRPSHHAPETGNPISVKAKEWAFPWLLFGSELAGTAILVAAGLSVVILDFGQGS
jgi:hypothetical protein